METAHNALHIKYKSALHIKYMVSDVQAVFLDFDGLMLMTVVKVIFKSHVAFFVMDTKSLLLH